MIDALARVATTLSAQRTGALIVLPGREPLERHIEGGIPLGGRLSEPLLFSIFDASSPGHDGAVIVRGHVVERFAAHLPLSANHEVLGTRGTRHAAALGLSERCDAICIVVSEERGTVSIARAGELRTLRRPEDLAGELRGAVGGGQEAERWWRRGAFLDAAAAVAGAVVLWVIFVPGSDVTETTLPATVEITNLPSDLVMESIDPPQVEVTLRGLRRDLLLANAEDIRVQVDAYLARLGRRTFSLEENEVRRPDGLTVIEVVPDKVRISVQAAPVPNEVPPD